MWQTLVEAQTGSEGGYAFKQHPNPKKLVSVVTYLTRPKVHIKFMSKSKVNMH
jgi:DNA-binding IscR family transcriptional regulator